MQGTTEVVIDINDYAKARYLNNLASKQEFDIDLMSGRYIVDAKSFMGIFSLDLTKPVKMVCHTEDAEKFLAEVKECLTKQ